MAITFSHLQGDALLNAALTCKDFLEEALDGIWKEIYTWEPLLKLFPALQIEDEVYVCTNVHLSCYELMLSIGP